jgi:hypothetical protein
MVVASSDIPGLNAEPDTYENLVETCSISRQISLTQTAHEALKDAVLPAILAFVAMPPPSGTRIVGSRYQKAWRCTP